MQSHLFSNIFSLINPLKQDDFISLAHYKIYKRLMKLVENKKIIIAKTTQNYAIIVTRESGFLNYYIIGLDRTTSKYFVNRIRRNEIINISSDRDIYNLLGYDYDTDIENITTIYIDGRYRAQGDIILNVRSEDDYITRLNHSIESHINSILNYIVITRIMNLITSEMNLNVRRVFDTIEIQLNDRVLYKYTKDQILETLVNKLYNLINEYKEILFSDIIAFLSNNKNEIVDLNITKTYNEIIIENTLMRVIIYVRLEGKFLIEIRVSTYYNYENVIKNVLNALRFTRIETFYGRHKIIFENAIANNLQILIKVDLKEIDHTIAYVNTHNAILAKNKIIIMHPEHGTKEITLNDIKTVSLESITNDLENEINSFNIISLINQQQNS